MIRAFIALELKQDQQRHLEKVILQVAIICLSVNTDVILFGCIDLKFLVHPKTILLFNLLSFIVGVSTLIFVS